jgi:hypothetical protein
MAGRGRGATLPAWMTASNGAYLDNNDSNTQYDNRQSNSQQFSDAPKQQSNHFPDNNYSLQNQQPPISINDRDKGGDVSKSSRRDRAKSPSREKKSKRSRSR